VTQIREILPPGLAFVRRTPSFTRQTVPKPLLSQHSVKAGMWGLLRVERGRVRYCLDDGSADTRVVAEGGTAVIEPQALHHVELLDEDSAFFVEFHKPEAGS
jgi:tellurite resistance-related uncharacterized protein